MPLLKGRSFPRVKSLGPTKPNETIYTIPHTKEQFRSKEYPSVANDAKIQNGGAHGFDILIFANLWNSLGSYCWYIFLVWLMSFWCLWYLGGVFWVGSYTSFLLTPGPCGLLFIETDCLHFYYGHVIWLMPFSQGLTLLVPTWSPL